MDFVRHTHLKLSYGRHLSALLLSPHYHQLHHSVAEKHWDKNSCLRTILSSPGRVPRMNDQTW
jgi:hypothetical protein